MKNDDQNTQTGGFGFMSLFILKNQILNTVGIKMVAIPIWGGGVTLKCVVSPADALGTVPYSSQATWEYYTYKAKKTHWKKTATSFLRTVILRCKEYSNVCWSDKFFSSQEHLNIIASKCFLSCNLNYFIVFC